MQSNVTIKNVSWPHFSWPTLYITDLDHTTGDATDCNGCCNDDVMQLGPFRSQLVFRFVQISDACL